MSKQQNKLSFLEGSKTFKFTSSLIGQTLFLEQAIEYCHNLKLFT